MAVAGANEHDERLLGETLRGRPVLGPEPTAERARHHCADKGYDDADVREVVEPWGDTAPTKSRGQEEAERQAVPGDRARRWVVGRTHSGMNPFRRLLIRREKKAGRRDLGFLHPARAWITCRAVVLLR